jgi:nicotinate-nucleotide adenylyltransferase
VIVGVFGGSFNPPHVAHVLAATYVLSVGAIDRLLVVPTFQHPFAKALAPFEDRIEMCEIAVGWLPRIEVSRVEAELGGESRTLRTLEHLKGAHPDWALRLVMGADLVVESRKWHGFEQIKTIAPPLVLGRVGVDVSSTSLSATSLPQVLPALSSTEVRAKLAAKAWEELSPLVPRNVLVYIRAHGLYGSSA